MGWNELFLADQEPSFAQMKDYVASPLWGELNEYLQSAYGVSPKTSYSACSGQPGWNVKYQKAGKSLCTLYPMEGFFIALVVIGEKERQEAELLLPSMTEYTQALYRSAGALMGAKWLMAAVTDESILRDVKTLIACRRKPK